MKANLAEVMLLHRQRLDILRWASRLDLPDCWLAAGFVRNLVWASLHAYSAPTPLDDIDVVYFDRLDTSRATEREVTSALAVQFPSESFSVKNQARMHIRNGHNDRLLELGYSTRAERQTASELLAPFDGLDDRLVVDGLAWERTHGTPPGFSRGLSRYHKFDGHLRRVSKRLSPR